MGTKELNDHMRCKPGFVRRKHVSRFQVLSAGPLVFSSLLLIRSSDAFTCIPVSRRGHSRSKPFWNLAQAKRPTISAVSWISSRSPSSTKASLSSPFVWAQTSTAEALGPRISINEQYPGLRLVHANPDVFVIENFLDDDSCQDLIEAAQAKKLETSPVAYAGWTQDWKDLVELAAKGPVAWLALILAWFQVKDSVDSSQINLVIHSLQNYAILFVVVMAGITTFTFRRAQGLQSLRTSTSTTLDDVSVASKGTRKFVENAAHLFAHSHPQAPHVEAALFEAPTVIRYEAGQVLAPHFDANRSAEIEDANRGGQTLATLLVYLNDVERGGKTRFGRLPPANDEDEEKDDDVLEKQKEVMEKKNLTIRPKKGNAILFFPADAKGRFDERTEHEGCPAIDEKWIARIWRHQNRVPPPFGLSESALSLL